MTAVGDAHVPGCSSSMKLPALSLQAASLYCLATGRSHAHDEEQLLVRQMLDAFHATVSLRHGVTSAEDVSDVYAVAAALGVVAIERSSMVEAGRLDFCAGGPVVHLNSRAGQGWARFTVMHELGHLLIRRQQLGTARRCSPAAVEAACDEFAATLLLPELSLTGHPLTLGALRSLASRHAVDVSVVADRYAAVNRCTFWLLSLSLNKQRRHWVPTRVAGEAWPFQSLPTVDAGAIGYLNDRAEPSSVRLAWSSNEFICNMRIHAQGGNAWALMTPREVVPAIQVNVTCCAPPCDSAAARPAFDSGTAVDNELAASWVSGPCDA